MNFNHQPFLFFPIHHQLLSQVRSVDAPGRRTGESAVDDPGSWVGRYSSKIREMIAVDEMGAGMHCEHGFKLVSAVLWY